MSKAGLSSTLDSRNASNACASASEDRMDEVCQTPYTHEDECLNRQRYSHALVHCNISGTDMHLVPKGGTLQGHTNAAVEFGACYQPDGQPEPLAETHADFDSSLCWLRAHTCAD